MHRAHKFNISWIDKYPDKEWSYSDIQNFENFDIWMVEKYPDKPWDFSYMHCASNFDITWVDKYPEKPWDFNEMHLHIYHYDKEEYAEVILLLKFYHLFR